MEILSDATFKGNVTFNKDVIISSGDLRVTPNGCTSGTLMYTCIGGTVTINGNLEIDKTFYLNQCGTIRVKSNSITFPSSTGTLALTSDIPSVPSVEGFLKYKKIPIDFDVAADCTVFTTAYGTGISSDKVVSLNLFKNGIITHCGAIKQVSADVWAIYGGENFVVEKSSAFAISSSDGYEIRAAYYE